MDTDVTIHLHGQRPLLMHNGRLANPLDEYARQIKAVSSKRQKTDADYAEMLQLEAEGSAYQTTDGLLGLPDMAVHAALYTGAKAFKRGQDVKRALIPDDDTQPLLVNGEQIKVADFLSDPENILYRSVVVQRNRTMRARPVVANWSSSHRMTLLSDILDVETLRQIADRAGRVEGIGDWRPTYGRFTAEVEA